jgi:hypothetical protein
MRHPGIPNQQMPECGVFSFCFGRLSCLAEEIEHFESLHGPAGHRVLCCNLCPGSELFNSRQVQSKGRGFSRRPLAQMSFSMKNCL